MEEDYNICDNCEKRLECEERTTDLRGWIFHEQLEWCKEQGKPSYETDDTW